MDGARNGLEVGCGFGSFVARVIAEKKIPFEGCELNSSAVRAGQSRGVPVRLERIEEIARRSPGAYDVVCFFQVLEHVTDPGGFLKSACEVLRPGGRLMLGVPDADSRIVRFMNVFDAPPHHMTRWSDEVLTRLHKWFPLKLTRIDREPLQDSKAEVYVDAYEDILRRRRLSRLVHPWVWSRVVRLVRSRQIRRYLKGETIYACYVRR